MNTAYKIIPLNQMTNKTMEYFSKLYVFSINKDYYPPNTKPFFSSRPWYMMKDRSTKIIPLTGKQYMEIFCPLQQKYTQLELEHNKVIEKKQIHCTKPYLLEISPGIFYRSIGNMINTKMKIPYKYEVKPTYDDIPDYDMDAQDYLLQAYR